MSTDRSLLRKITFYSMLVGFAIFVMVTSAVGSGHWIAAALVLILQLMFFYLDVRAMKRRK